MNQYELCFEVKDVMKLIWEVMNELTYDSDLSGAV